MNASLSLKIPKGNILGMKLELNPLRGDYDLTIFLPHGNSIPIFGKQAFTIYQEYLINDECAFIYET